MEIQCTVCGKSKCIKEFANSQRRDIDFAVYPPPVTLYLRYWVLTSQTQRCRNCVQDILEADPLVVEPGPDDEESTLYSESRPSKVRSDSHHESCVFTPSYYVEQSESDDSTWPRLHNDRSLVDDFDTESQASFTSHDDEDDDDQSVGGGVWVEPDHDDDESVAGKDHAQAFTAYDPQGVGHQRRSSPQPQASSIGNSDQSGWQTWGGKKAGKVKQSGARPNPRQEPKKRNDRWAKIKVHYIYSVSKWTLTESLLGRSLP